LFVAQSQTVSIEIFPCFGTWNTRSEMLLQFGGLATVFDMLASSAVLSVMAQPAVAHDNALLIALYYLQGAFGGVGFSVPMGLLLAGISVNAALTKLLPKWVIGFGLLLALVGELSWINMISSGALFLP
jgi:hypothetical protein